MNLRSIFVSLPLALLLLAPACSPSTDAPRQGDDATAPVRRQKIGKADLWGSCEANGQSLCGGKSAGNCWCDAACEGFGDCCADYDELCGVGCAPLACKMACPYGLKKGEDGCDICACEDPPSEFCGGFANLPCPQGKVCVDDPNDSCDPQQGGADCGGICVVAPAPTDTCADHCGGPSADKSCYCDDACTNYGDCCDDYDDLCSDDRTPASGACVKNSNDACTTDADCAAGGCGGELCYNPAFGGGISTCECAGPAAPVAGCGCVAGHCTWYN